MTHNDVGVLLCGQDELREAGFDSALILLQHMKYISLPLHHVSSYPAQHFHFC